MWWHSGLQAELKFSNSCFGINEIQWHEGHSHLETVNYYERKSVSVSGTNWWVLKTICVLSQRPDHTSIPVKNALKSTLKLADSFPYCFQWKAFPNQITHVVKKLMLFVLVPLLSCPVILVLPSFPSCLSTSVSDMLMSNIIWFCHCHQIQKRVTWGEVQVSEWFCENIFFLVQWGIYKAGEKLFSYFQY